MDGVLEPVGERWQAVHASYVKRFGPRAATIGPPQDAEPDAQAR